MQLIYSKEILKKVELCLFRSIQGERVNWHFPIFLIRKIEEKISKLETEFSS